MSDLDDALQAAGHGKDLQQALDAASGYPPPPVAGLAPPIPGGLAGGARKVALTTWEGIWYVIHNIALGGGYFAKVPAKKALQDFGLVEMTAAEHFWYVVMCIWFGFGYFAKIPTAKALSELPQYQAQRSAALGSLA